MSLVWSLAGRRTSAVRRSLWTILAISALCVVPHAAKASFQLGIQDPSFDGSASVRQADEGYHALSAVGGSYVRLNAYWSEIAPPDPVSNSAAANPGNPGYSWSALDVAVRRAATHHVRIILLLLSAPLWAEGPNRPSGNEIGPGAWNPNATMFGAFARAVADRYSGHFADPLRPGRDLPRIKDFEIWNEENLPLFLAGPHLVREYQSLLDRSYGAIKAVHKDNLVAVGGLGPVSDLPPESVSPLKFAAELMCLRRVKVSYVRTGHCRSARFDVLAHHPYTLAATPTEHASSYDDLLVGDVGKLRDLLDAARRLHTISPGPHPLWITEWGWITDPPDTKVGDRFAIAARYVAYSMYEMWQARASLIIWQGIRDETETYLAGGGLETRAGSRKPQMQAFAFPFVALSQSPRGLVWGRVPGSRGDRVTIEWHKGNHWQRVGTARTSTDGVFAAHLTVSNRRVYRAVAADGRASLPYLAAPIPARRTHTF